MRRKFTVYGIETSYWTHFLLVSTIRCNSAYHLWYWNDIRNAKYCSIDVKLQQYLPLAVCDEGWETVEERSDDEVRTSLVPDQKDGKTKRIEWKCLPLAVLKLRRPKICIGWHLSGLVTTAPTTCGMRRRVRGSRGVKRRWGPHISSPWLKGRENKGDEVTVLTACGIETGWHLFVWRKRPVATVLTACGI